MVCYRLQVSRCLVSVIAFELATIFQRFFPTLNRSSSGPE